MSQHSHNNPDLYARYDVGRELTDAEREAIIEAAKLFLETHVFEDDFDECAKNGIVRVSQPQDPNSFTPTDETTGSIPVTTKPEMN